MSTRTAAGIGTGRAPIPAASGSGVAWRSAGSSGPSSAWASALIGSRLGRGADSGRVAAGVARSLAVATGDRVRARSRSGRRATRAGWPGGSRRSIPSWAPGSWPRSRRTQPRRPGRLGLLADPPSSARPSTTAAPHDWDETVPDLDASRHASGPCGGPRRCLIAVAIALAGQARSQAEPRTADRSPRPARPTSRSIRATPRSSAAPRSWSSPASRAPCRPRRASSSTTQAHSRRRAAAMTRSLEDPTFAGRVESVDADLAYRVEFDGRSTETYHVTVFEYPELAAHRRQARLPATTRRSSRRPSRTSATSRPSRGPS